MNCAIYIRKSREDKTKPAHRLTVQREQLPAYAKAQGWLPIIYDDGHASAARGKVENLEQRNRLEADIREGKINVILTIELSRLSRDDSMQDYTSWLYLCGQHQVKLATMSRTLDPSQHSDWMLLLMEGGFSSVEMRVLRARMKEGRDEAIRDGRWISGNPPMPYKYDRGIRGLVVDPNQIEIFNQVINLAANHSARKVAQKVGLPFIRVRRAILDDRLLMYQGRRLDPQTGEMIQGQWPAVITEEQAAAIIKNRRAGHRKPRRKITGLFSNLNLMTCEYCGRTVCTWANGRKKADGTRTEYYGCRNMIERHRCAKSKLARHDVVNPLVLEHIVKTLADIDSLRSYWLKNQTDDSEERSVRLRKKITNLKAQKNRLINAITEGVIEFSDAKEKRHEIDNAIDEQERRLAEIHSIKNDPPEWEALNLTSDDLDLMTVEEIRELLPLVLQNISINNEKIILTYKFPRTANGQKAAEIKLPPPRKPGKQLKR